MRCYAPSLAWLAGGAGPAGTATCFAGRLLNSGIVSICLRSCAGNFPVLVSSKSCSTTSRWCIRNLLSSAKNGAWSSCLGVFA